MVFLSHLLTYNLHVILQVFSHKSKIMATIKLTIDAKRSYADGRVPIIYRLTHNTKTTRIESGVKILKEDWDPAKRRITKSNPESKALNVIISTKLLELEKKLLGVSTLLNDADINELKEALINDGKPDKIFFYEFAIKEINHLKNQERFGNAQAYETALNRLISFTGKQIRIDQINYTLISDFDNQLLKDGLSRNTVAVYMREIRALLNKAIHKGLLDKNIYPFSNYKIKTEKTVNRAIFKDDLEKIKMLPLKEGSSMWHSRNIFFLIFNLIGVSFIDLALLTHSSIQGERIVYRRRKTGKIYSIKLTDEARRIISIYRKENTNYLVSCFKLETVLKSKEREEIALRCN